MDSRALLLGDLQPIAAGGTLVLVEAGAPIVISLTIVPFVLSDDFGAVDVSLREPSPASLALLSLRWPCAVAFGVFSLGSVWAVPSRACSLDGLCPVSFVTFPLGSV